MEMKEKCVYYDNNTKCYYLVIYKDDKMIYGRRGEMLNPKYLDVYMSNVITGGLKYKINDDIIIYDDYIRNYYIDEKDLENFEFITELSDDEFNLIKVSTNSNYKFMIDLKAIKNQHMKLVNNIIDLTKKIKELTNESNILTVELFRLLEKDNKK